MADAELAAAACRVQRIYKGRLQRTRLRRTVQEALAASRLQVAWNRHSTGAAGATELIDVVIRRDVVRVQRQMRRVLAAHRETTDGARQLTAADCAHAWLLTTPSSMAMRQRAAAACDASTGSLAQRASALADAVAAERGGIPAFRRPCAPDAAVTATSTPAFVEAVILRDVVRLQRATRRLLAAHREATGGKAKRASVEDYAEAFLPSSQVMRHRAACLCPSPTLAEHAVVLADRAVAEARAAGASGAARPKPRPQVALAPRYDTVPAPARRWGCLGGRRAAARHNRVAPVQYSAEPHAAAVETRQEPTPTGGGAAADDSAWRAPGGVAPAEPPVRSRTANEVAADPLLPPPPKAGEIRRLWAERAALQAGA